MAFKDNSKEPAFRMWKEGKSLSEIQKRSTAKPDSVKGWILDWERGRQKTWTPQIQTSN